ncbi:MAG: DUF1858 domain-containing protein [Lachnospiraceae bacterium]|nr:DUF1858 domain-containing protein [Lachnospiraceae bacterium]
MQVKKEMVISDIIRLDEGLIGVLMAAGMHCVGCPSAQAETLEEASLVHGLDPDAVTSELNKYLASQA